MPADRALDGHDIVVVGASAGGVEALGEMVARLPEDLPAAVFVVLHISATGTSVLPAILERRGDLPAAHAVDEEPIAHGRIYIAPPDHHLFLQPGIVRVVRGPKENGYRPAIDPLFRSAAHAFGPRVIGVILSGVLDDGTAGLAVVKMRGGRTLVQDPSDALYDGMPSSAIEFVGPEQVLPSADLAAAIAQLADEPASDQVTDMPTEQMLDEEEFIQVDRGSSDRPQNGLPSGFTCPECGGGLWESDEGGLPRYRCRTGHGYSIETLLAEQSGNVEAGMWAALRALEERAALTRRMASRFRARGRRSTAERFERQGNAAVEQGVVIRRALDEPVPDLMPEEAVQIK